MAFGTSPFETTQQSEHGGSVAMAALGGRFSFPDDGQYSESFRELVKAMIKVNPDERPDISQVRPISRLVAALLPEADSSRLPGDRHDGARPRAVTVTMEALRDTVVELSPSVAVGTLFAPQHSSTSERSSTEQPTFTAPPPAPKHLGLYRLPYPACAAANACCCCCWYICCCACCCC